MTDHHLGERLGNLEYHLIKLGEEIESLEARLAGIRATETGEEKIKRERDAFSEAFREVKHRHSRMGYQIEGVKSHVSEDAVSRAETIRRSNLGELGADGEDASGFERASDLE